MPGVRDGATLNNDVDGAILAKWAIIGSHMTWCALSPCFMGVHSSKLGKVRENQQN